MRLGINFLVTLKGERMETYSQNLCLIQNNGVGAGFMAYAKINREFIPTMCFPSFAIAAWSLGELYKHLLIKPF